MLPRIKTIKPDKKYVLHIEFDDGKKVLYDMEEDMDTLPGYDDLRKINGLFEAVSVDESRTCIMWNDYIDLPSDTLYEYGEVI